MTNLNKNYIKFKYIFDRIICLLVLILFFPIFLIGFIILAIIIKIDSRGPIFYKQKRIGLNGKHFYIYKFRTMYIDKNIEDIFTEKELREYKKNYKLENDPRVTKIGRILRKFSIDETPQILNVIKGDMSIIGPRPVVDGEINKYGKNKKKLLSVKPGLSGNWTCYCTKDTTYKKRIEMELYYVDNLSFKLDFKLFIRTITMLLNRIKESLFMKNKKEKKNKPLKKDKPILNIKLSILETIITIFSCLVIVAITSASYRISQTGTLSLLQYEYMYYGVIAISIILIILAILGGHYKFRLADVFMILMLIFALISTFFSYDIKTSIFGIDGRCEGLLIIAAYYFLFTVNSLIKNDKLKRIIIVVFFVFSLFHLRDNFFTLYNKGLAGHHNFFGTYCLLVYALGIGLFLFTKEKKLKYISLFISSIYFPYLISCVTSSVTIGVVLVYVAIICYLIILGIIRKKGNIKNRLESYLMLFIKLFIVFDVIIFCFISLRQSDAKNVIKEATGIKNDIKDLASGNVSDNWGTQRGFIWKETLKKVPEYWLHGVGIDCLVYAWDGNPLITPVTNRIVDKAHNEYLQIMITEGVFSVVTYIAFLFYIFITSLINIFKNEKLDNSIYIGLFLTFIGYAIQAFANIRTTRVAPYFFILMGLLYKRDWKGINAKKAK